MSDSGIDQRREAEGPKHVAPLSPAALAERVTMLVSEEAGIRGGELPMWRRLDARPRRSVWARLLMWTFWGAAWCAILILLAIAALRVFWHDGNVPLTLLNAFTLYLYLPAYFVLALAAWKHRWWLATACAAVIACHVAWVAPDFQPTTRYVPPSASATAKPESLRIFYANVLAWNLEFDAMINEALRADADVIVLAELYRPWVRHLIESDAIKAYPYGTNMKSRHSGDVVVFSRLPISRRQMITAGGRVSVVVDIQLGGEAVRLFCLHSPRPTLGTANEYREFWREIVPILAEEKGPLVVIGDFNATQHSLVYQQLTSDRLRSAHVDRGRGYATTWPNWQNPVPPIRIDQALLSPDVECISIAEGEGPGSDHKPLVLDVRVHAPEPSTSGR